MCKPHRHTHHRALGVRGWGFTPPPPHTPPMLSTPRQPQQNKTTANSNTDDNRPPQITTPTPPATAPHLVQGSGPVRRGPRRHRGRGRWGRTRGSLGRRAWVLLGSALGCAPPPAPPLTPPLPPRPVVSRRPLVLRSSPRCSRPRPRPPHPVASSLGSGTQTLEEGGVGVGVGVGWGGRRGQRVKGGHPHTPARVTEQHTTGKLSHTLPLVYVH
jgi:hypothetical protein